MRVINKVPLAVFTAAESARNTYCTRGCLGLRKSQNKHVMRKLFTYHCRESNHGSKGHMKTALPDLDV